MFPKTTVLSLTMLTVLVASVLLPTSMGMKGAYPGLNGLIAFSSPDGDQVSQIFVMNTDGTGIQQITFDEGHKYEPCWSPDSETIAFTRSLVVREIYSVFQNGTGLTQVTTCPDGFSHSAPAWSPDGGKIAYSRYHHYPPHERDVYLIQPGAGGEGVKLIDNAKDPSWSPDGTLIAYHNLTDFKVWIADAATGTPIQNVTSAFGGDPCWSPDGQRLTYFDTSYRICVIDVDGTNHQQISDHHDAYEDEDPNWSPDGSKILFCREEDSIWITDTDGSDAYDLTPAYPMASGPDWARGEPKSVGGEIIPTNTWTPRLILLLALLPTGAVFAIRKKPRH